jgi:GT2 family glycosyltransferase
VSTKVIVRIWAAPDMETTIGIVIPTRGRGKLLRRLLCHLAHQPQRHAVTVCVVHDGEECACQTSKETPLPEQHISQTRAGPAAARNRGVEVLNTQWLVFLDDDCVPQPDYLKELLLLCAQSPPAVYAGQIVGTSGHTVVGRFLKRTALLESHSNNGRPIGAFAPTANLIVHSSIFRALGGFAEQFRVPGGEDNFFCLKMLQHGFEMCAAQCVSVHHDNDCTLGEFLRRFYWYGRGFCRLLEETRDIPRSASMQSAIDSMSTGLEIYTATFRDLLLRCPRIIRQASSMLSRYSTDQVGRAPLAYKALALASEFAYQFGAVVEFRKCRALHPSRRGRQTAKSNG